MKRVTKISLVCLALLIAAAFVGVRMYLHSSRVLAEVTNQIKALYGGSVKIGEVDIGFRSSTIRDLQFFESGDAPTHGKPWLEISSVIADVSLWHLIRGDSGPTLVRVQGAKVVLRFGASGQLLTRLPTAALVGNNPMPWDRVPPIIVDGAEIILRKEGQKDIRATDINARLDKEPSRLVLNGTADSEVGKLAIDASLEEESNRAAVNISTQSIGHFREGFLERLPFVPAAILREIQVQEGNAKGKLSATYDLNTKAFHYHADVSAQDTRLYLPSLGVAVKKGRGTVICDDSQVQLVDLKGEAFGGAVYASGDVDLRGPNIRVTVPELRAEGLDVDDVPDQWNLPAMVRKSMAGGKLFGKATLDVTLGDADRTAAMTAPLVAHGASAVAAGHWLAPVAQFASIPHDKVRIKSKGRGEVRDPIGRYAPIEFDWQLAPHHDEKGMDKTGRAPGELRGALAALITLDTAPAPPQVEAKPRTTTDYIDLKFNLKNASLAELVKNEDLRLPFAVQGQISLQVKASIPTNRLADLKAYKAEGTAQIVQLAAAGVKLEKLTTNFRVGNGALYFEQLKSTFADKGGNQLGESSLTGHGKIQMVPLGEIRADFDLNRIPVHRLADQSPDKIQGTVSGNLSITGQADKLQNARGLEANGKLSGDRLRFYGFEIEELATSIKLRDGVLSLPDLRLRIDGVALAPTASLKMNDDHSFDAKVAVRNWDLAAIRTMAAKRQISLPALTGTLNVDAAIKGNLKPGKLEISGDLHTQVVNVDAVEATDVHVRCTLEDKVLKITELNASLFDGKATGSATLPIDGKSPGSIDLRVKDLNVQRLARDLRIPIAIEGHVDGTIKGALGLDGKNKFAVDFKAPRLRVQNIPTEQLQGTLEYQQGKFDYNLTGKTLGGAFDLEGQIPSDAKALPKPDEKAKEGRLRIRGVRVGRLLNALGVRMDRELRGNLNIDVHFTHGMAEFFPHGQGTLRIADVQWGDTVLAENLQGEILLADQRIRLRNLSGVIAQGTIGGQAVYYLHEPERSGFSLNLDAVESGLLLSPWLNHKVDGPIQARIRGKLGSVWRGEVDVELTRGKVYGLQISQWRVPVIWSFSPREGRGQVEFHEAAGQVVGGRASGKMNLSWENSARVEGSFRLERVELRNLLRQTVGRGDLGSGTTTAKFDFKGNDVRSLNDISGVLTASFQDAQALQVPVLQQVAPILGVGPSTTFQKGILSARLQRGTATIQQFTLQGNNVQMFIDGSISLDERLNLHVVAKTGDIGWPTLRLGPIGVRVPVAGPVPLVVLQEVSAIISNHVAYLDVTGTPSSPVIRPRPVPILSQEAIRFFLNRSNSPITLNP